MVLPSCLDIFPKHEPDLPGHVFDAFALAARHGHTHILDDIGRFVKKDDETDFMLAEAFSALKSKTKAQDKFNDLLRNAYEPDGILAMFEQRQAALRYADYQMAKVMNASSVKIDFLLPLSRLGMSKRSPRFARINL